MKFILKKLVGLLAILFIISLFFGVYTLEGLSMTLSPPVFMYNKISKRAIWSTGVDRVILKLVKNGDYYLAIEEEVYKYHKKHKIDETIYEYIQSNGLKKLDFINQYFLFKNVNGTLYYNELDLKALFSVEDELLKVPQYDMAKHFKSKEAVINFDSLDLIETEYGFEKTNLFYKLIFTTGIMWVEHKILLIVGILIALIIRKKLTE